MKKSAEFEKVSNKYLTLKMKAWANPYISIRGRNPLGIVLLILTHCWRNSIIELTLRRVPYFVYYSSLVDNLRSGSMVEFVRNPHERLGRKCFGISLLETSIYFVQFFSDTQAQWTIWSWKISFAIYKVFFIFYQF